MKKIAVLGSTGSIGTQTLDVVRNHSDFLKIEVLAANNNDELLDVDYSGNYGIYQFSETGTCPGIDGLVDRSYASIDYGKYIEQAGFNQLINTEVTEKVKVLQ